MPCVCVCPSNPLGLQRLCDYVCDLLLEESNVQPVSTPVTVCGDIHGQVGGLARCLPKGSFYALSRK